MYFNTCMSSFSLFFLFLLHFSLFYFLDLLMYDVSLVAEGLTFALFYTVVRYSR